MLLGKKLKDLKNALGPYLFYWDEWTTSCNNTLSDEELEIISYYMKIDFQNDFPGFAKKNGEAELINRIFQKLESGYQVFVLFVVTDFLYSILKLAKNSSEGFQMFLESPINDLDLPHDLKEPLLNFKVHTISLIFVFYKPHELRSGLLYKHITDFQIAKKREKVLLS